MTKDSLSTIRTIPSWLFIGSKVLLVLLNQINIRCPGYSRGGLVGSENDASHWPFLVVVDCMQRDPTCRSLLHNRLPGHLLSDVLLFIFSDSMFLSPLVKLF